MNTLRFFIGCFCLFFLVGCGTENPSTPNPLHASADSTQLDTLARQDSSTLVVVDSSASDTMEHSLLYVKGNVSTVYETGRGPLVGVTLKREDSTDFYFETAMYPMSDFWEGQFLEVKYLPKKDTVIVGLHLVGETIKTATKHLPTDYDYKKTARENFKTATLFFLGTYLDGSNGDLGKYVTFKEQNTALKRHFMAYFTSEVDDVKRYAQKEVRLYGVEKEVIEIVSVIF